MRYLFMFLVVVVVFVLALSVAAVAAAEPLTVRPVDAIASETLDHAIARSATVRSLATTIAEANVIVHVESSRMLPGSIAGTTRFVTSRGEYRYVRIVIDAALPLRLRSVVLGHELQHARELAESGAHDATSVQRLFERTGHRIGEYFETRAALAIERTVRIELTGEALPARTALPGK